MQDGHTKTTNVTSNHRDLEDGSEVKHPRNREPVMLPQADIISKPFSNMRSSTGECGTSDNEWAFSRTTCQQSRARSGRHHGTE